MRRGIVFVAAFVLGALFVLAPVAPRTAGADLPDQVGWWNKLEGGLPVPLPVGSPVTAPPLDPSAPAGSIQLAVDPSGPTAIGALRYDSVPDGSDVELVLKSTRPLPPPQFFAIALCTATTPWLGVQNGAWASRPSWSDTCATPAVSTDTLTWNLDSSFLDGGLSVVLVPSGAAVYQVTIAPPDDASLSYTAPPPDDTTTTTSTTLFVPEPEPFFEPPTETVPVVTSPPTTAAPVRTPTTRPQVRFRPAVSLPKPLRDTTRAERIMAVSALLGLLGAWWWIGGQPTRNPRLLGSVGAAAAGGGASGGGPVARQGGVGRFARLRTTAPRRL